MKIILCTLMLAALAGCAKVDNGSTSDNDSLAVIPVGPGTQPDVIVPPDTPQSAADTQARRR